MSDASAMTFDFFYIPTFLKIFGTSEPIYKKAIKINDLERYRMRFRVRKNGGQLGTRYLSEASGTLERAAPTSGTRQFCFSRRRGLSVTALPDVGDSSTTFSARNLPEDRKTRLAVPNRSKVPSPKTRNRARNRTRNRWESGRKTSWFSRSGPSWFLDLTSSWFLGTWEHPDPSIPDVPAISFSYQPR